MSLPAAPASRRKQVLSAHSFDRLLEFEDLSAVKAGKRHFAGADQRAAVLRDVRLISPVGK